MEPIYQTELANYRKDSDRAMRARLLRKYPRLGTFALWTPLLVVGIISPSLIYA